MANSKYQFWNWEKKKKKRHVWSSEADESYDLIK
jgi:hypothetical protein